MPRTRATFSNWHSDIFCLPHYESLRQSMPDREDIFSPGFYKYIYGRAQAVTWLREWPRLGWQKQHTISPKAKLYFQTARLPRLRRVFKRKPRPNSHQLKMWGHSGFLFSTWESKPSTFLKPVTRAGFDMHLLSRLVGGWKGQDEVMQGSYILCTEDLVWCGLAGSRGSSLLNLYPHLHSSSWAQTLLPGWLSWHL